MVLEILKDEDEHLHKICTSLGKRLTKDQQKLASDMMETVAHHQALGLAAPQVGSIIRMIVVKIGKKYTLMINPAVLSQSNTRRGFLEQCLSFPGKQCLVKRAISVKVKYRELNGKDKVVNLDGLDARVFLHEYAHIQGLTMDQEGTIVPT